VFAKPAFAGTPGMANCHGQSVSVLAQQFGGLDNAAAALGFPTYRHCRMPSWRFARDSGSLPRENRGGARVL
jgi:hypothetical protein